MKVDKAQTSLELWRIICPFLPAAVQGMRVEKVNIKFSVTARSGTTAEAYTVVVHNPDNPYVVHSKRRRDKIVDPYGLYNALRARIDIPEGMVKLDVTVDPNKRPQIKYTGIPIIREEHLTDGDITQQQQQ